MEICQSTCVCANWDQSEIKNDKSDLYLKELLDNSYNDELESLPHIQIYITGLKSVISIQTKKIRKLRNKLHDYQEKKLKNADIETRNVETQTSLEDEPKSIVDDITAAATHAVEQTGFVYEETSGLYYDYNSGYYYNAEYGLYYDGTNGIYYRYNEETREFDFHSKVDLPEIQETAEAKRINNDREITKRTPKRSKLAKDPVSDEEEGECSSSSSTCSNRMDDYKMDEYNNSEEIANAWPPCMRLIVTETKLEKLNEGMLFIVTCDGGKLGREGDHSIIIPDINVSKHHATFSFNRESGCYEIVDLGSRNGTLLNGKRMSVAKQESDAMEIKHDSIIQVGCTKLLCHIHPGTETCDKCEPGLVRKVITSEKKLHPNRENQHKSELHRLRKKFGIAAFSSEVTLADGYSDRAQKRRETVGSSVPHAKTEMASVDQSISKENKGFKLLKGMGWSEGESLGKEGTGRTEPVPLISNVGTSGLGAGDAGLPPPIVQTKQSLKKDALWRKMQERFENAREVVSSDPTEVAIEEDDLE